MTAEDLPAAAAVRGSGNHTGGCRGTIEAMPLREALLHPGRCQTTCFHVDVFVILVAAGSGQWEG